MFSRCFPPTCVNADVCVCEVGGGVHELVEGVGLELVPKLVPVRTLDVLEPET